MGADSCQSMFGTREVTASSQCRGEDAVGVSQRRSITWDCSCLDKNADGFSFQLKASTARYPAGSLVLVCDKKKKKIQKRAKLMSH